MVQEICSKMHLASCTNIYHDVTDLVNQGWLNIQKLEYLENGTYIFYETEKFLIYSSDDIFWEVTVL